MTSFAYDAMSRRTGVYNTAIQANALLAQTYSGDGLLATLTDGRGNVTTYAYDGFDRLATATYPLGSTETFTYDANGNPATRKTRANQTSAARVLTGLKKLDTIGRRALRQRRCIAFVLH